jgi:hypothetical protein
MITNHPTLVYYIERLCTALCSPVVSTDMDVVNELTRTVFDAGAGHMWADLEALRSCRCNHQTRRAPTVWERGGAGPSTNCFMHWASSTSSPGLTGTSSWTYTLRTLYQVSSAGSITSRLNITAGQ